MTDFTQVRLGRKAIKTDSRTLRLARYLTGALPAPPSSVLYTQNVASWGMMGNDTLGDCTIAGAAHAVQVWTLNSTGAISTVSDPDVVKTYSAWDGYVAGDESTDQGGVELDVLNNWRKQGLAGHTLTAFAAVNPKNLLELRTAIYLFGGVYVGLNLPISAQGQDTWDVAQSPDGYPGSWGGHCVYVPDYDTKSDTYSCITWGGVQKMTSAFWLAYGDEAYALLSPEWKLNQPGFDADSLQRDLALIR